MQIRGLDSGRTYTVSIVAVDGKYKTSSDPQDVETSNEGPLIQHRENVATAGWFIGMFYDSMIFTFSNELFKVLEIKSRTNLQV